MAACNEAAAGEPKGRVARALGVQAASAGLFALNRVLGAPAALRELGMRESGIDQAVGWVMQDRHWNPHPPEPDAVRAMLRRAWTGTLPAPG